MKTATLVNDFNGMFNGEDSAEKALRSRRIKAVNYLESLSSDTLTESQIQIAFDIIAGRI